MAHSGFFELHRLAIPSFYSEAFVGLILSILVEVVFDFKYSFANEDSWLEASAASIRVCF